MKVKDLYLDNIITCLVLEDYMQQMIFVYELKSGNEGHFKRAKQV